MESLLELFVQGDDFCQAFQAQVEQHLLSSGVIQRHRDRLTFCEIHRSPERGNPYSVTYENADPAQPGGI